MMCSIHYVILITVFFIIILYHFGNYSKNDVNNMVEICDHDENIAKKFDKYISNAANTNGVIYRQHQREIRHLLDMNRHKKYCKSNRLINEFMERQQYIDENIDTIRRDLLNKYMKKIRPYVSPSHCPPYREPIKNVIISNCEDALALAIDLNSEDDIRDINTILRRVNAK